jgi:hypothetical protein
MQLIEAHLTILLQYDDLVKILTNIHDIDNFMCTRWWINCTKPLTRHQVVHLDAIVLHKGIKLQWTLLLFLTKLVKCTNHSYVRLRYSKQLTHMM